MKRTITWVRHGQTEWNAEGKWQGHTDTPLSDLGREQARCLSRRFQRSRFDAVYSSDLARSLETCRLALPGAEVKVEPRLREINFGVYEGMSWSSLTEQARESVSRWWMDPYLEKLEKGESMACLNTRVEEFLTELPEECDIAVFTHGGVIRNALWQIVGPPLRGAWSVQLDNTGVTVIEYGEARTLIRCVNERAHLDSDVT